MPFVSGDKIESTNRFQLAIGAASVALGADLANGTYLLTTDANCYIKHGAAGLTVSATSHSAYLPEGGGISLTVDGAASARFAVIQRGSATGNLNIQQVRAADPNA